MSFLQIVKLILSLFPLIIQAVQAVEAAVPAGGNGAAKLDSIRQVLQGAYSIANDAAGKFEDVWPAISGTVGAVVSLFNKTGAFKTGA